MLSCQGIAVHCENTNLASMAVGLRRFDFVDFFCIFIRLLHRTGGKIKNLTIVNCNLERLYGDVFRTNKITKLVIRDTPIRFYLLPEVKTVVIFATSYFKSPSFSPNLWSSGSNFPLQVVLLFCREIRNDTFIGLEDSLEELIVENSRLEKLPVVSCILFFLFGRGNYQVYYVARIVGFLDIFL